jgi:hypothetical protein
MTSLAPRSARAARHHGPRQHSIGIGSRIGRLEVVTEGEPYFWRGRFSRRRWQCVCDCGEETEVREDLLQTGHTQSCGCLRDDRGRERLFRHGGKAGGAVTPEYTAWQAILHRSGEAPVCRRWRSRSGAGFAAFLQDMGRRPGPTHRLVRTDPSRAFGPGNCAWVAEAPRRGVPRRLIRYRGQVVTLRRAAEASGVAYGLLCKRLERGWSVPRALQA